jgi:hypothetical protein
MRVDVDYIISLLKEYTPKKNSKEIDEQEAAAGGGASTGGGGGGAYPTVTKWETGLTRGPANQIGVTKWNEIVKLNRGKANTLL